MRRMAAGVGGLSLPARRLSLNAMRSASWPIVCLAMMAESGDSAVETDDGAGVEGGEERHHSPRTCAGSTSGSGRAGVDGSSRGSRV